MFEIGTILKVPDKLVIVATNPLICYLIVKISYKRQLLITKLIFIGMEFEVFKEISCTYNGSAKPGKETNLVYVSQNNLKTRYLIYLKINI